MAATVAGASRTVASNTTLPAMVVFDLDACLWAPEMFQLPSLPTQEILAQGRCVGLRCAPRGPTVELFPGALHALRKLLTQPEWRGTRIAAASSSLEPAYSFACLRAIEVLPGRPLLSDDPARTVFQHAAVGRTGRLSPDKRTHFSVLTAESGVPYSEMLFFDDCIWGDNVADVETLGVVGVRTPQGLTIERWDEGVRLFAQRAATASR